MVPASMVFILGSVTPGTTEFSTVSERYEMELFNEWILHMIMEILLEEAKASCEMYKTRGSEKPSLADTMYDALAVTLQASDFDNGTRLGCLFKQLLKCTTSWKRKEEVCAFTVSVIAADYYLSVGKGIRAVPFLNKALGHYAEILGTIPASIEDADRFVGEFRAQNLKGKFKREFQAVKNVFILIGAAQKLRLDLCLEELPADYCPTSRSFRSFLFILAMGITGTLMVLTAFNEHRVSRFAGEPIPFLDSLQPSEIPMVVIGLILVVAEFILLFWQYTPSYNRLVSRFHYWRFSRG